MSENTPTPEELIENIDFEVADADVIPSPVDPTLTKAGEAADAKATGDAIRSIGGVKKVNNQTPDGSGNVMVYANNIPMSNLIGAQTVTEAITAAQGQTADTIRRTLENEQTIEEALEAVEDAIGGGGVVGTVRSVNGVMPDEEGDITLDRVNIAGELESFATRYNAGTFIQRTTGGTASVNDGTARLIILRGNAVKTGYVPQELSVKVNSATREAGVDPISVAFDEDTFLTEVTETATITLNYTNTWSESPSTYGVTVVGTPVNGDQIVIVYVKDEQRGTLSFSNPRKLISTGWNLYKHTDEYTGYSGYAKVVKYSDEYGYRIEGDYTTIKFSTTISGAKTTVAVSDHKFVIPSDGYIWITGGNSTDTAIFATWADWQNGYKWNGTQEGTFSPYTESVIDLTSLFVGANAVFPYGLLACGTVRDEINLNIGKAYSKIERMSYNAENLETAQSSGREYDYDTNYIYLAKETVDETVISISGEYTASDHGIEYFDNTTVPVTTYTTYGFSLRNKLERDVLTISQQTLDEGQKRMARENIDAVSQDELSEIVNRHVPFTNANFMARTFTYTYSIPAGEYKTISANAFGIYSTINQRPIGLLAAEANHHVCITAYNITATGSDTALALTNVGENTAGGIATMTILYANVD